ncbi:CBS domain-containing protein [Prauserella muralis]|uniref:Histidine kinase n=1 Tax=Prauserella muralis TaxID=588067 RepID=A0A2V4AZG0_9PSEU|nr:CBS domain-containing protein [Prauserella muralis]PXY27314.1 histidine kinase [Prauserella muralis]TWE23007.1 CBS domain protein [Prauserella muralis]
MTQVREIMTSDPACVDSSDTVAHAARKMADADVGALPIRGEDNQLKGMLTDRDIVVRVLAEGKDPVALHASELARGDVVTVRPDDDVAEALDKMARHQVRRLPVVEGQRLVGIVAQADAARHLDERKVGGTVESISES